VLLNYKLFQLSVLRLRGCIDAKTALLEEQGETHLSHLRSLLILLAWLLAGEAFAQEKIDKPGFIPAGVMVCDELDCKFLSDLHETAAKIMSYEPAVGVHVILNGKSYVVPGEDVFIQTKECKLRLHSYLTKNFVCEQAASTENSVVQNRPEAAVPTRPLPGHGQMFVDPLQRMQGEKPNPATQ